MERFDILRSYTDKQLMQADERWSKSLRELRGVQFSCDLAKSRAARDLGITDGPITELADHLADAITEIGVLIADILIEEARRRSLKLMDNMKEEDK